MTRKKRQLWIHPEFAKELKKRAAEEDINIIDLTEKLARRIKKKNGVGIFDDFDF